MRASNYILVFISLFLFTSFSNRPAASPFIGLWHDHHVFMYSCSLWINADGSFMFRDRGCTESSYSEGKCKTGKMYITLLSFKEYKPPVQTVNTFSPDDTISTKPIDVDSVPRYFNNIRFELAADTLYQLTKTGKRKGLILIKQ